MIMVMIITMMIIDHVVNYEENFLFKDISLWKVKVKDTMNCQEQ